MKRKIINISLIASLFLQGVIQPLSAGLLSDMKNSSFMNSTPGGSYSQKDSNGETISNTFTTKSVYFRFGPSMTRIEPMWQSSPPSIGASCSGFNMKGMFINILGLERIAKMLKSAGASFAWGIMIGLIYSLPGVASTFNMINAWAKKIQEILQAACSGGQRLGEAIMEGTNVKTAFKAYDDKMKEWSPEKQLEASENGSTLHDVVTANKYTKAIFGADDFDDSDPDKPTVDELTYLKSMEAINSALSGQTGLFIATLHSILDNMRSRSQLTTSELLIKKFGNTTFNDIKNKATNNNVTLFYSDTEGDDASKLNINNLIDDSSLDGDSKLKALIDLITAAIIESGNTMVSNESISVIIKNLEDKTKALTDQLNPGDLPSLSKSIFEEPVIGYGRIVDAINTYEKGLILGEIFSKHYLGGSEISETNSLKASAEKLNDIKAPSISFVSGPTSPKGNSNSIMFVLSNANKSGQFFPNNLVNELTPSAEHIFSKFQKFTSFIVDERMTTEAAASSAGIPELINLPEEYLTILAQSPEADRAMLKDNFSFYAACQYIEGFQKAFPNPESFGGSTGVIFKTDGSYLFLHEEGPDHESPVVSGSSENLKHFSDGFKDGFNKVLDNLESYYGKCNETNVVELRELFKKQAKENAFIANQRKITGGGAR